MNISARNRVVGTIQHINSQYVAVALSGGAVLMERRSLH